MYAPNIWPERPRDFKQVMLAYHTAMSGVAANVLRAMALALAMDENYFADKFERLASVGRIIRYPAVMQTPLPGQLRAAAHTDYGCITFVRGDDTPGGLQVKARHGDWIDVHIPPDAFVCNIGDTMMRWSNDHWVSNLHRVAVPPPDAAPSDRISLVFFHNPNPDTVVRCFDSCIGSGAKYPPVTSGEYYLGKLMKAGHSRLDASPRTLCWASKRARRRPRSNRARHRKKQNDIRPIGDDQRRQFSTSDWLAHTQRNQLTYRLDGDALKEAMDDAMALVVREQEELGLHILTDGEMRRTTFVFHIAGRWDGVDIERASQQADLPQPRSQPHGAAHRRQNRASYERRPSTICASPRRIPAAPLKMAVPGPMTVIDSSVERILRSDERISPSTSPRPSMRSCATCRRPAADVLQIDEPAMTRYHDKVRAYGAKALDRCLDGITVPTIVHLCYGYPGGGGLQHQYHYEAAAALMHTRIGGLSRRIRPQHVRSQVLALCGGRIVMFGCIDPGDFTGAYGRRRRSAASAKCSKSSTRNGSGSPRIVG